MINDFQTPDDFTVDILMEYKKITYRNCHEISQGGPVVGELSIDGRFMPDQLFGGPLLFQNRLIYVPILVKKFLGNGFKLAVINIDSLSLQSIGNIRSLIFLDKIENGRIYFFEDVARTRYSNYHIED